MKPGFFLRPGWGGSGWDPPRGGRGYPPPGGGGVPGDPKKGSKKLPSKRTKKIFLTFGRTQSGRGGPTHPPPRGGSDLEKKPASNPHVLKKVL